MPRDLYLEIDTVRGELHRAFSYARDAEERGDHIDEGKWAREWDGLAVKLANLQAEQREIDPATWQTCGWCSVPLGGGSEGTGFCDAACREYWVRGAEVTDGV